MLWKSRKIDKVDERRRCVLRGFGFSNGWLVQVRSEQSRPFLATRLAATCWRQRAPPGQPATDMVLINDGIFESSTSYTGWS